jgi:uroporphyrinogen-III decarboxylase
MNPSSSRAMAAVTTTDRLPRAVSRGHGIVPQTPPEHVASLVEQVRAV